MAQQTQNETSSGPAECAGCCTVDALVSVDQRGQMVLPKDVREKAGIQGGEKLAVASWETDGRVCCLSLVKVEELTQMLTDRLGPVMEEILRERSQ